MKLLYSAIKRPTLKQERAILKNVKDLFALRSINEERTQRSVTTKGFTLIEIVIVMAIFAMIITLSSVSLLTSQRQSLVSSTVDTFIADARHQQVRAMTSDSNGNSFGIYFSSDGKSYTLFTGTSYTAGDSSNYQVTIPSSVSISAALLPITIVFNQKDGTIGSATSIKFSNNYGPENKTIHFNTLGVIDQVN